MTIDERLPLFGDCNGCLKRVKLGRASKTLCKVWYKSVDTWFIASPTTPTEEERRLRKEGYRCIGYQMPYPETILCESCQRQRKSS